MITHSTYKFYHALFQECSICFETFKEYWNDDEEEWKLKNCVPNGKMDGRWAHRTCLS